MDARRQEGQEGMEASTNEEEEDTEYEDDESTTGYDDESDEEAATTHQHSSEAEGEEEEEEEGTTDDDETKPLTNEHVGERERHRTRRKRKGSSSRERKAASEQPGGGRTERRPMRTPTSDALTRVVLWNRGLNHLLQWSFIKWSKLLHRWPVVIMLLSAIIAGGLGLGLLLEHTQDDEPRLWLDDGSAYVKNEDYQMELFGEHEELLIITAKQNGADLLSTKPIAVPGEHNRTYMEEVHRLHMVMLNVSVVWHNRTYTTTDLCVHPNPEMPYICRYYSILDYWRFNLSAIQADVDPHATVSAPGQETCFHQPLLRNLVVGGMTFDFNGTLAAASAFKSIIYIHASQSAFNHNPDLENIIDAWEKQFVNALSDFSKQSPLISVYLVLQASLLDKLIDQMVGDDWLFFLSLGCMFIFLIATLYSFDCVISKVLLTLAGVVHILLAGVAATGLNGFFGITITPLSQTLYFLVMALGINHIILLVHAFERTLIEDLISSPVLNPYRQMKANEANPELVKNLYVPLIQNHTLSFNWRNVDLANEDVVVVDDEYWINGAMARACPTITIECLIEIIAFLAISISSVPGLRSFGQQAALAVGTEYFLLISFFACCLILDSRRIMNYRSDILPCISCIPDVDDVEQPVVPKRSDSQDTDSDSEPLGELSKDGETGSIQNDPLKKVHTSSRDTPAGKVIMIRERPGAANRKRGTFLVPLISRFLAPFLLKTPVRVVLLACLLGFAGLGIYGLDKWEQSFIPSELYSSNSPEYEYYKLDERLFPTGSNPIQIITTQNNYTSPLIGSRMLHLEEDIRNTTYVDRLSFYSWYGQMVKFLQSNPAYNSTLIDGRFPPPSKFYSYLAAFLNSTQGQFFQGDILFTPDKDAIVATRFMPLSLNLEDLVQEIDAIGEFYDTTDEAAPLQAFPYDPSWSFFMTFPAIQSSSHIYLILAFSSVFIVTFVLMDAVSCFIVLVNFVSVHLELLGIVMHFSSPTIPISQLSLATIVITTALAVTYTVHILQHFVHGGEDIEDRNQRIIHTLSTTGYSLTCGFFCVILGCLVAFFMHSAIFLTFVHLFAISLALSWGNTILLVPILMSFLGVW